RARARDLAGDLDNLATVRRHLRDTLLQSPVCDAPRFAAHLSAALRGIWQRHCRDLPPAALTFSQDGTGHFEDQALPVPEPIMPSVTLAKAAARRENAGQFHFDFSGKIVTLDNGGQLLETGAADSLLPLGAFELLVFDPLGEHASHAARQRDGLQVFPQTTLGNGEPAVHYACLDPSFSATLKPLPDAGDGARVLTELPVNTVALDSIEGLPSLDWLVLDHRSDSIAVLENGAEALKNTLLIQVTASFDICHADQPDLGQLFRWAEDHGFRLYRLNNAEYRSHLPARLGPHRQATELNKAKAIYIPNRERLASLDTNQRIKLGFLLHSVYGINDLTYSLLFDCDKDLAEQYLADLDLDPSGTKTGAAVDKSSTRRRKVFLVGFPKSGTSTIQKALESSGYRSAHWKVSEGYVGELMQRGLSDKDDPWYYLQQYEAITQADVCLPQLGLNHWPNLDFGVIEKIKELYPDCLFILNYRDPAQTVSSIKRWGDMQARFRDCDIEGLPAGTGDDASLHEWIVNHMNRVRTFFENDDNFVEIDITSEKAPDILQAKLGVKVLWWGVANRNASSGLS
ncbi:MAG: hypothetical protein HRT34_07375, partial [Alcanivorax sp.]|nr:hypothetical protein [Alcanivorax sp.]